MSEWWRNEFYSQFGEDSILFGYFRSKAYGKTGSLKDIGTGYFVDVGSHHPYMISNTWFFYQRGWRGINVDPTPGVLGDFEKHRPEDVNLQLAIASTDGTATFYSYGRNVANTLDAARVKTDRPHEAISVETMRLDTLLDRHLPAGQAIDFLSVDVEGVDLEVLRSNDWRRYRPEMLIVELHERNIDQVLASEMYREMRERKYGLFAWTPPSLIFRRIN